MASIELPSKAEFIAQLAPKDCPICYAPITNAVKVSLGHMYCFECALRWFEASTTCPTCRQKQYEDGVVVNNEEAPGANDDNAEAEENNTVEDGATDEWTGIQQSVQSARDMEGGPSEAPDSITAEASFERSAAN